MISTLLQWNKQMHRETKNLVPDPTQEGARAGICTQLVPLPLDTNNANSHWSMTRDDLQGEAGLASLQQFTGQLPQHLAGNQRRHRVSNGPV